MRRGFKAQAERLALSIRAEMELGPAEPVRSVTIAEHLGIELRPADELIDRGRLQELQDLQYDAFSGATFRLPSGRIVVVFNPLNDPGRTNSDVAHEISHLILEHPARTVERVGGLNFFTCDAEEEQEANWLAGCLLLPRPLLVKEALLVPPPKTLPRGTRSANRWPSGDSTPAGCWYSFAESEARAVEI